MSRYNRTRWAQYRRWVCRNCGHVQNTHITTMRGKSWCKAKRCRHGVCPGFVGAAHQEGR